MQHQNFIHRPAHARRVRQHRHGYQHANPHKQHTETLTMITAALAMLHKFCCLHAQSIAFPELVLPLHKVGGGVTKQQQHCSCKIVHSSKQPNRDNCNQ